MAGKEPPISSEAQKGREGRVADQAHAASNDQSNLKANETKWDRGEFQVDIEAPNGGGEASSAPLQNLHYGFRSPFDIHWKETSQQDGASPHVETPSARPSHAVTESQISSPSFTFPSAGVGGDIPSEEDDTAKGDEGAAAINGFTSNALSQTGYVSTAGTEAQPSPYHVTPQQRISVEDLSFELTIDDTSHDPTVIAIDDQTTLEDERFSYDAASHFDDVDAGDSLTYSVTGPDWLTIDPVTGELSGTPDNGDVGDVSVTVSATDGNSAPVATSFTLTVDNVNDAPTVTSISDQTATEDSGFSYDAASHFDDVDAGDSLTYSVTGPDWLTIDPVTGELSGTPDNGDVGDVSVTVSATDGNSAPVATSFTLTVDNVNDAPTVTSISDQTATEDTGFSYDAASHFDDVDAGDSLTYSVTGPDWLTIDPVTGELSGTPDNGDVGDVSVTVSATDGNSAPVSTAFTLTVDNVNDAPTVTSISDQTATEDTGFSYDAASHFDDVDAGDSLTYSVTGPDWLTIDPVTGELSGTPDNGDVGDVSVTVSATDGNSAPVATSFTLTVDNVNDAPTVTSISDQTATEDSGFSYDAASHFDDVDAGDSLTYSVTGPDWLTIDPVTGELSGTPDNGDVGDVSVTVSATDGNSAPVATSFTLTVDNVNDAPTVTSISDQSATEDAGFSYDAASHFDDVDAGDSLTYSVTGPDWLTIDPVTGELSGTPDNGDVGDVSVTVSATDGNSAPVATSFTLTVDNVNDAPTVTSISDQTATEDSGFSYDAASHFDDVDAGDSLTYSVTGPDWLTIDPVTGELSGTPDNGDVGDVSVTVSATDGNSAPVATSFTLTVDNVNDAPTVTSISDQTATEDTGFSYDAASHFDDVDAGDSLTYSVTGPDWLTIDPVTGELSGTPDNGDVGDVSVTVSATDGNSAPVSTAFTLTVDNVNDAPTVTSISDQTATEDTGFSYDAASHFDDVDAGDSLTYSVTGPDWLTIDPVTGELSGTPDNGDVGDVSVTVSATDGNSAPVATSFTLTVDNVNDAPTVTSISDQSATEDAGFSYDAASHFDDVDAGDSLTYSVTGPDWLTIDPVTGELSGTPDNAHVGDVSVTVSATDGNSAPVATSFTLTVDNVNDAPTVTSISDQTATEDTGFSYDAASHFDDVDAGDSLTYSVTGPDWLTIDPVTGELSGTPDNAHVGDVSVTVSATDGNSAPVSTAFTLTVDNVNDAPTVTSISDQTATEDTGFSYDAASHFDDVDAGDSLTYSVTGPDWLTIDPVTGELSGTPDNGDVGDVSVTVSATDGNSAPVATSFTLTVDNVNDAPTVTSISDQTATEDSGFSYDAASHFDDVDAGDSLTYSVTGPDWLTIDPVTGELSGTPDNGDVGDVSVTVSATDGNSAPVATSFTLTVDNVNDAPTVTSISDQSATEDAGFSYDAASHFDDVDAGDSLTYSVTGPDWLTIDPVTGELSGTPDNGDVGDVSVTVSATDGNSAPVATSFTLTVDNVNDAPTVTSISDQTATEDTGFSYDAASHFDDVDAGDSLTYSVTGPDWLTIDPVTGELSGTPDNGDVGDVSVTVSATDGNSAPVATSFTLTVDNVNDAPTVTSISDQTATEDSGFSYDAASHFDDVDAGDSLTYSVTGPDWLTIDPVTGELSGTPDNGDVGDVSVTVSATDGNSAPVATSFTLTVDNVNDAPTVTSISDQTATEDTGFSYDAASHFDDVDAGDSLTYSVTGPDWLTIDPVTGELSGTPDNGDVGDVSVTVSATDGNSAPVSTAFTLTVDNVNDAPTVTSISDQTATEDTGFSYDAASHFDDVDAGDSLTYSVTGPDWLTIDPVTGELSGTPDNGDVGDVSVTVSATDGNSAPVATSFTLTVDNVNDAPTVTSISDQSATEDAGFSYDAASHFDDVDAGDSLTYSVTGPDWLTIDPVTGELSGTPDNAHVGDVSVTVSATDGNSAPVSTAFTLTVDNVNDAPTVTSISDQTATEDTGFSYDAASHFDDVDAGDSLTYSVTGPDWLTIDPVTGELSGTPDNGDVGDVSVTVSATDGNSAPVATSFTLTVDNVNDAPTVSQVDLGATTEDNSIIIQEDDLLANANDVDAGDSLSVFSVSVDAAYGTITDNGNGTWTFTPKADYAGDDVALDFTVTDGTETVASTALIDVTAEADAPTLTLSVGEGTSAGTTSETILSDDFSDGNYNGWSATSMGNSSYNWSASSGELQEQSGSGHGFLGQDLSSQIGNGDYTISADIDANSVGTYNNGVGFVFGYEDSDNYYIAHWEDYSDTYSYDNDYKDLKLVKVVNGVETELDKVNQANLSDEFSLSVTVNDSGISVSVDGTEMLSAAGEQPAIETFGLYTNDNDSGVSYDNVVVTTESNAGTTFPVTIAAGLTDLDGSESLSDVSISGLPDGAILSAGTDNGSGNWTVSVDDLDGLTMTVPSDVTEDFTLSVSVTATDSNGDTETSTLSETVDVPDPNLAPTDIDLDGVTATTTTIDTSNALTTNQGFSVTAKTINPDGSLSSASSSHVNVTGSGIGVSGSTGDYAPSGQLGYDAEENVSEELIVDFDNDVSTATFDIAALYDGEGGSAEAGQWVALNDGVEVGQGTFIPGGNDNTVSVTVDLAGTSFDQLVFKADPYKGGQNGEEENSSDYYVSSISFTETEITDGAPATVSEDASAGTVVGQLSATDPNEGDTFTYQIVDSGGSPITDSNFEIVGDKIVVKEGASLDYESDTSHNLIVEVTDSAGNSYQESFTISVTDVYEEGNPADQNIYGDSGDDYLLGGGGEDYIEGDSGDDYLSGGADDDYIVGDSGEDTLLGGSGDDVLLGGKDDDDISGGTGDDYIAGDSGDDTLFAGAGDDTVYGGKKDDSIDGGAGDDYITGDSGDDTLFGGAGDDTIIGGKKEDSIAGGEGDDSIYGDSGDDTLFGGAGDDTLYGGDDDDLFIVGENGGNDVVHGGNGWADVIQVTDSDGSSAPGDSWTVAIDGGSTYNIDSDDGYLDLGSGESGTITFTDGSEVTFDGVERIEW